MRRAIRQGQLLELDPPMGTPGATTWQPSREVPQATKTWRLKRNCALTPGQYTAAMATLMGVTALVALACWTQGLWLVPVFSVIELAAIVVATFAYAAHAVDGEIITLTRDGKLYIEQDCGRQHVTIELHARQVRILCGDGPAYPLWVHHGGHAMELGRQLQPSARVRFEHDLRKALRAYLGLSG